MKSSLDEQGPAIERLVVSAFAVATDSPEADGTLSWQRTILVTVELSSAGETALGYTYADRATASLIVELLAGVVVGQSAWATARLHHAMRQAVRNLGNDGVSAMAISAVDVALWDLKARLLNLPLVRLLGEARAAIDIYGSGGFTSYDVSRLEQQLVGFREQGISRVKMKVGTEPAADVERVREVRRALGPAVELFVDANGAYSRKQALRLAEAFAEQDVRWFEEPVSSDDLSGLSLLVERAPACMEIAAGEYGYRAPYFEAMLAARAVDVLQADATRCGGVTGFLQAAALCEAHGLQLSSHCAPALHAHLDCAASCARHLEYFHDHVRVEQLLFEGVPQPREGKLAPLVGRPGLGLALRHRESEPFRVFRGERHWERP